MYLTSLSLVLWCATGVVECRGVTIADTAKQILKNTGVKGGLIVHIHCGDGKLTAALRASDRYRVHGLDADANNIAKAREHIRSLGLYGQVSVEQLDADHLPYADQLVNLVVSESLDRVPMDEVLRVLVPNGVAYIRKDGQWIKAVKPWPANIDEWTHYLHDAGNNAVAQDSVVGPPRHLQWLADPLYCRSHEIDSSVSALVSAAGRVFCILDEGLIGITDERLPSKWSLAARDAFNGILLWKRPMNRWGWQEWKKDELAGKDWTTLRGQRIKSPLNLARRLVASGDRVYVTLGYNAPLTMLDGATGQTLRTYPGTEWTDEILCGDGFLLTCIREDPTNVSGRHTGSRTPERLQVFTADSGETLWNKTLVSVLPLSLALSGDRVFFHNYKEIVCLDLRTGEHLWRRPSKVPKGNAWRSECTLVAHNDTVLFLGPQELLTVSAETGEVLWRAPGGRGPGVANPPDLFVADGLVWYGEPKGLRDRQNTRIERSGFDPASGKVIRTVDVPCLVSPGHHYRCYRSKATDRYLLLPKRGVEFLDLEGDTHMQHDWLRAACRLGFMPCNGLLYITPHQCFCYAGAKLNGFNALAPQRRPLNRPSRNRPLGQLERGPAYARADMKGSQTESRQDWPMHRHDIERSGSTSTAVDPKVKLLWQRQLKGKLTAPVVANGKLLVASIDEHCVFCMDNESGTSLWHFTAGGRVDSPPTIHRGLVFFGSADGCVYCLRLADGELVWRFSAGPEDRRVISFEQLESAWPIHGSVLVNKGVVYFAAGRSSYLDGGICLYGLDPQTGKVIHQGHLDGPYPDVTKDIGRPFDMEGAKSDLLVSDGTHLYMQQVKLDHALCQQEAPRITQMGDRRMGRHLLATGGLLDDSWWNRTFWMYSDRWPGFYIANQAPKAGQLLVFDDTTTYGVKCYTTRNRHSPMFFPGKDGYLLFADDNDTEPVLIAEDGTPKPVKWLPDIKEAIGHKLGATAVDKDKGTGFTRSHPPKWFVWVPIRVRAMVLVNGRASEAEETSDSKTLFVAGPPDVLDPEDPLAAFEGRKGGLIWAVSARNGAKRAKYDLDSPPVFDGMIAADGCLYLSMIDGRISCFEGNPK
jgi:outer membrane protein assembly factor BamB